MKYLSENLKYAQDLALAGVTQWIEYWPANLKVASSTPSQGMYLGCGPGVCERQSVDVSLIH